MAFYLLQDKHAYHTLVVSRVAFCLLLHGNKRLFTLKWDPTGPYYFVATGVTFNLCTNGAEVKFRAIRAELITSTSVPLAQMCVPSGHEVILQHVAVRGIRGQSLCSSIYIAVGV